MDFNVLKTVLRITLSILSGFLFSKYRLPSLMFRSMTWFKRQRRGVKVKHTDHEGYRFSYFTRGEPGPQPSMLMLHGFSLNKDIWLNTIKVGFHFLFGKPHRAGKAVRRCLTLRKDRKDANRRLHVPPSPPSNYLSSLNSLGDLFTDLPNQQGEEKCLMPDLSCKPVTEEASVTKPLLTQKGNIDAPQVNVQGQHQTESGVQEKNEAQIHSEKKSLVRNPSLQMDKAENKERGNKITSPPELTKVVPCADLNDINISAQTNVPGAGGVPQISQINLGPTHRAGHNLNQVFGMGLDRNYKGVRFQEIPPLTRSGPNLIAAHSYQRDRGSAPMPNPGRMTYGDGFLRSPVSFPAHVTGGPVEVMTSSQNKGMTRSIPTCPQPTHRDISAPWESEVVLNDADYLLPFPPSYRRRFNREAGLVVFPDNIPWMTNMESTPLLVPPDNTVAFNTFSHDGFHDWA